VKRRLESDGVTRRGDLLDRLVDDMCAKRAQTQDIVDDDVSSFEADVVTDAMLLLTAGSDTTANSTAAILFWIFSTPRVLEKLRNELTEALPISDALQSNTSLNVVDEDEEAVADSLGIPLHNEVKKPQIPFCNDRRGSTYVRYECFWSTEGCT